MKRPLKDVLADYFKRQGMPDFVLVFAPPRKGRRRSKRGNVPIEVDGKMPSRLSGRGTAAAVIKGLLSLSSDLREWTDGKDGKPKYKAVLTDPLGDLVASTDKLEDLRRRVDDRREEDREEAKKVLNKALDACDKYLDRERLLDLVEKTLKMRYQNGKTSR